MRTSRVRLPDGLMLEIGSAQDVRNVQRALAQNYEVGWAHCQCIRKGVELTICRMERNRSVVYYLRSHPGGGHNHAPWCFFEGASEDARVGIREDLLRLEGGWSMREPAQPGEGGPPRRGVRRMHTTLAELVRELWGAASLTEHDPENAV